MGNIFRRLSSVAENDMNHTLVELCMNSLRKTFGGSRLDIVCKAVWVKSTEQDGVLPPAMGLQQGWVCVLDARMATVTSLWSGKRLVKDLAGRRGGSQLFPFLVGAQPQPSGFHGSVLPPAQLLLQWLSMLRARAVPSSLSLSPCLSSLQTKSTQAHCSLSTNKESEHLLNERTQPPQKCRPFSRCSLPIALPTLDTIQQQALHEQQQQEQQVHEKLPFLLTIGELDPLRILPESLARSAGCRDPSSRI